MYIQPSIFENMIWYAIKLMVITSYSVEGMQQ